MRSSWTKILTCLVLGGGISGLLLLYYRGDHLSSFGIPTTTAASLSSSLIELISAVTSTNKTKESDASSACTASEDGETCKAVYEKQQEDVDDDDDDDDYFVAEDLDDDNDCTDQDTQCGYWASLGECDKNPGYMLKSCQQSCNACPNSSGEANEKENRRELFTEEELLVGLDLGVQQSVVGLPVTMREKIADVILEGRAYWQRIKTELSPEMQELCQTEHAQCAEWVAMGECDANPGYMKRHCAPLCKSCDYLSIEGRCPIDPEAPLAWGPGDLNKMFTRLTSEPYLSKYDVKIHSSPDMGNQPWVITMENVISEEESDVLIELGAVEEYKQSADVGKLNADGTFEESFNSGRTSTNAWCQNACYENATAHEIGYRLSNLTGIPELNSEFLQLLRYEPGQFYRVHHDYIDLENKRQQGPRLLTLYLYLNDVEEGGGTNFDRLNITVMPKRGRALLWPSVKDEDPTVKDPRTTHQALPVVKGIKYGANGWYHLRDFKTPNRNHCM